MSENERWQDVFKLFRKYDRNVSTQINVFVIVLSQLREIRAVQSEKTAYKKETNATNAVKHFRERRFVFQSMTEATSSPPRKMFCFCFMMALMTLWVNNASSLLSDNKKKRRRKRKSNKVAPLVNDQPPLSSVVLTPIKPNSLPDAIDRTLGEWTADSRFLSALSTIDRRKYVRDVYLKNGCTLKKSRMRFCRDRGKAALCVELPVKAVDSSGLVLQSAFCLRVVNRLQWRCAILKKVEAECGVAAMFSCLSWTAFRESFLSCQSYVITTKHLLLNYEFVLPTGRKWCGMAFRWDLAAMKKTIFSRLIGFLTIS